MSKVRVVILSSVAVLALMPDPAHAQAASAPAANRGYINVDVGAQIEVADLLDDGRLPAL